MFFLPKKNPNLKIPDNFERKLKLEIKSNY